MSALGICAYIAILPDHIKHSAHFRSTGWMDTENAVLL